ncbi:MAG TPA: ABC transporter permease [Thermoanaerobaculia bacterium]|nr:ABC transporter permease [Thermoanaerobaculia bacterium]
MLETAQRILRFRGLLQTLVARELKARYRGSFLGFFWSLVNPLLLLSVYTAVFGFIFRPPRAQLTDPYALFLVTGLFPWIWVSASLLEGTQALIANAGLIRKAVFPSEILPMIPVFANLVHFLFALPILAVALIAGRLLGHPVGGWSAAVLPLVVLLELPLVGGIALGLAALNVHFKDVRDLLANLLTLLFFLTPILYPLQAVAKVRLLYPLVRWGNPFSPFTLAFQSALFSGRLPSLSLWLGMLIWSGLGWAAGSWLFARLRDTLVEAV